uniref:Ig-like domain-containing protein n=1 Tax=Amphiprion percula TaxID=161767 RepID=A0A3P8TLJ4_AMPPE
MFSVHLTCDLFQFSELHDASSKPWIQLGSFTALVFLLLTPNCSGLSQVVGPSQQVPATVGGDVLLSCRLEPAVDASAMSIEWSREDLDPSYVYVWWDKEELESSKHPAYKGRTSLLFSELKFGDVSLKLSKVKLSDKGKYRCFIPALGQGATVELVVGELILKIQDSDNWGLSGFLNIFLCMIRIKTVGMSHCSSFRVCL